LLQQSVKNLDRLYGVLRDVADIEAADVAAPEGFLAALCDDMNTPKALAELFALSKSIDTAEAKGAFLSAAGLLGLLQQPPDDWFSKASASIDRDTVEALIAERAEARSAGDYAKADAARDKLTEMGVVIEDGPGGTIWRLAR
jgi:cysteinyl-tRNA synthetase